MLGKKFIIVSGEENYFFPWVQRMEDDIGKVASEKLKN